MDRRQDQYPGGTSDKSRSGAQRRPDEVVDGAAFRSRAELWALLEQALRGRRRDRHAIVIAALHRAGVPHPSAGSPLWVHEFTFAGLLDEVPGARRRVAEFAADCALDGADLYDLALAAGEALSNAVKHGSPNGAADLVSVRIGVVERGVAVQVTDGGPGFDTSPAATPLVAATGGRGIAFMRGLLDWLSFDVSAAGTAVLLVKHCRS